MQWWDRISYGMGTRSSGSDANRTRGSCPGKARPRRHAAPYIKTHQSTLLFKRQNDLSHPSINIYMSTWPLFLEITAARKPPMCCTDLYLIHYHYLPSSPLESIANRCWRTILNSPPKIRLDLPGTRVWRTRRRSPSKLGCWLSLSPLLLLLPNRFRRLPAQT
jgi:hypothetical protein